MTSDKEFLSKWEQHIEYKKVKDWGRDWNNEHGKCRNITAQKIIDELNLQEVKK